MSYLKLKLRVNTWYAIGTIKGKPIKKSSGYRKEEKALADKWVLSYELGLHQNKQDRELDNKPFKQLIKLYRDNTPDLPYKEGKALDICVRYLGEQKIISVTTDLNKYIIARHKNSKDNSIDRDVRRIRAIINYGYGLGLCSSFKFKYYCKDDTRNVYAEVSERDRLFEVLPRQYRDFYIVLNFQGLRFSQAKNITGNDIHGDELTTITRKGQRRRVVNGARTSIEPVMKVLSLHPRVQAILQQRIALYGNEVSLFPEINYQKYRLAHIAACIEVGMNDYRIHDNRKTFATLLVHQTGATDRETATALGQSSIRNVYKYSINRKLKSLISKLS